MDAIRNKEKNGYSCWHMRKGRTLLIWLALLAVLFSRQLHAQKMSPTYDLMLKGLLAHSVPEIKVHDAAHREHAIFLDAREKKEYQISHIRNAKWIGYESFDLKRLEGIHPSAELIVYCSVGYRSEKIAEKLLSSGFTRTFNLYGGIFEWVNEGHAVYDRNGRTDKIHAYDKKWGIWLSKGEKIY